MVLVLLVMLILFCAKQIPNFTRGLRNGIGEFTKESDQIGFHLGENFSGIFGRRVAEALTPDNHTVELYDPVRLREPPRKRKRGRFLWLLIALAVVIIAALIFW